MASSIEGWWTGHDWEPLDYSNSTLSMSVGANAMLARALSDGRMIEETHAVGRLANGIDGLLTAAEAAGGRRVWMGVRDPWADAPRTSAALVVWPWATLSLVPMHLRQWARVHVACADATLMSRILGLWRRL